MSYPDNIPKTRSDDAPSYDESTLDSNLGIFTDNKTVRIMWDKYGPITNPQAFKESASKFVYKCYVMSR